MAEKQIAIILIRGLQQVDGRIRQTLSMLHLEKRNVCVIVPATASFVGMITKVRSYVTYGEIDAETLKLLRENRGEGDMFHLNSPRKGYGRKGIKKDFKLGGALGNRGVMINDLIKRMI
ncbi:MAG TPA: uL30 family ribosomal protein [Candidatus Nanoarchaeia archaeon]|nr:uL30 family ribosomal protein [Candidatus Nanoarchaeia archaeon]